jgi:hypothetical protein
MIGLMDYDGCFMKLPIDNVHSKYEVGKKS